MAEVEVDGQFGEGDQQGGPSAETMPEPDPLHEAIEALEAALERLTQVDLDEISHGDDVLALYRSRNRLDCLIALTSARFSTLGEWQASGARSAVAWLTHRSHAHRPVVGAGLSAGRALRDLPLVEAAYSAGEISAAHVRLFKEARSDKTAAQMAKDEGQLVGYAKEMSFTHFAQVMTYWFNSADPDGAEEDYADKLARRNVFLAKSFEEMYLGNITLDPISGEIVSNELERLAELLRQGGDPDDESPKRTPGQLRADALVEMARRSRSTGEGSRRPEPLFSVLVGWETLHGCLCQTESGSVLPPSALLPWLDCAWLERVVFDSASRVIDVGVTQRLFTGATRRAVEVRDQQCFHPTCEEPPGGCQVDHIQPFSAGGPTTTANGRLACGFHNRARHEGRGPP